MIKPWPLIASKPLGDFRVFRVRTDQKISPRTQVPHDFFVLDAVPWVNVIALTKDGQVVLVEQFRHGTNTTELEIPGGVMDQQDSSPVATGVRELREETGYEGSQARVIGEIFPNPAIMSNTCYTVLIENCELKHSVQWDTGEDIRIQLAPTGELPKLVAGGKIRHALVVVALYHFELLQRGLKQ
jgi:8-oxo-dGTP pyrophosphatase MutT (NUDIX family)